MRVIAIEQWNKIPDAIIKALPSDQSFKDHQVWVFDANSFCLYNINSIPHDLYVDAYLTVYAIDGARTS